MNGWKTLSVVRFYIFAKELNLHCDCININFYIFLIVVIFAIQNKETLNSYFFDKEKLKDTKEEKLIIKQFNILFWIGFLGFMILCVFSQMIKK